jgi:hypothetical protein
MGASWCPCTPVNGDCIDGEGGGSIPFTEGTYFKRRNLRILKSGCSGRGGEHLRRTPAIEELDATEHLSGNKIRAGLPTKKPRDGTDSPPTGLSRSLRSSSLRGSQRVSGHQRYCCTCPRHQEVLSGLQSRWRAAMPGGVSIANLLLGYSHDGRWRILSRHR